MEKSLWLGLSPCGDHRCGVIRVSAGTLWRLWHWVGCPGQLGGNGAKSLSRHHVGLGPLRRVGRFLRDVLRALTGTGLPLAVGGEKRAFMAVRSSTAGHLSSTGDRNLLFFMKHK